MRCSTDVEGAKQMIQRKGTVALETLDIIVLLYKLGKEVVELGLGSSVKRVWLDLSVEASWLVGCALMELLLLWLGFGLPAGWVGVDAVLREPLLQGPNKRRHVVEAFLALGSRALGTLLVSPSGKVEERHPFNGANLIAGLRLEYCRLVDILHNEHCDFLCVDLGLDKVGRIDQAREVKASFFFHLESSAVLRASFNAPLGRRKPLRSRRH